MIATLAILAKTFALGALVGAGIGWLLRGWRESL